VVAALLLGLAFIGWAYHSRPREAVRHAEPGPGVVAQLSAQWEAGEGRGLALAGGLIALASLASSLWLLRGMARSWKNRQRAPSEAPDTERGPTQPALALPVARSGHGLALTLVLYGATAVVAAVVTPILLAGASAPLLQAVDAEKGLPPNLLRPLGINTSGELVEDGDAPKIAIRVRKRSVGVELEVSADADLELWVAGKRIAPEARVQIEPSEDPAFVTITSPQGPGENRREWTLSGPTWREHLPAITGAVFCGLLAVLAALVMWSRGPGEGTTTSLRNIGVHSEGWAREIGRGAVGYLGALPLYVVALAVTQVLASRLGVPAEHHPMIQALERDPGLALWVVISAALVAPLLEEVLFRGLAFGGLRNALGGVWPALLAQAFLFAAIHPSFSHLLPMLTLGLVFGLIRATSPTQSLVGSVVAHTLHNGLTLTLALVVLLGSQGG
jgi:membrane protease YdiL (CAAX protease family)